MPVDGGIAAQPAAALGASVPVTMSLSLSSSAAQQPQAPSSAPQTEMAAVDEQGDKAGVEDSGAFRVSEAMPVLRAQLQQPTPSLLSFSRWRSSDIDKPCAFAALVRARGGRRGGDDEALKLACGRVAEGAVSSDPAEHAAAVDAVNASWQDVIDCISEAKAAESSAARAEGDLAELRAYTVAGNRALQQLRSQATEFAKLAKAGGDAALALTLKCEGDEAQKLRLARLKDVEAAANLAARLSLSVSVARVRVADALRDARALRTAFAAGAEAAAGEGDAAAAAAAAAAEIDDSAATAAHKAWFVLGKLWKNGGATALDGGLDSFADAAVAADLAGQAPPPPARHAAVLPLAGVARVAAKAEYAASLQKRVETPAIAGATTRCAELKRYDEAGVGAYRTAMKAADDAFLPGGSATAAPGAAAAAAATAFAPGTYAAAQTHRRTRYVESHGRLGLLRCGDRLDREAPAQRRFVQWGVRPRSCDPLGFVLDDSDKRCVNSGILKYGCYCGAAGCGKKICDTTRTFIAYCDCGGVGCGGGLCDWTGMQRNRCFCGSPKCGNGADVRKWVALMSPVKISVTGTTADLLRCYDGCDGTSFDVRGWMDKHVLTQLFEYRLPAGDVRIPIVGAALSALFAGSAMLVAHSTGRNGDVASISRSWFLDPPQRPDGLEDVMGEGVYGTAEPFVAERFRSKFAWKYAQTGNKARLQRCFILSVVLLKPGQKVITVSDPTYVQWPRAQRAGWKHCAADRQGLRRAPVRRPQGARDLRL